MKSMFKFIGVIALVAVIGFSMAACGGDDDNPSGGNQLPATSGSVTFTGLGAYNGKYVIADGDGNDVSLIAAEGANYQAQTITGGKISGGSVTLKVWQEGENNAISYSGNDQNVEFDVVIFDTQDIDPTDYSTMMSAKMGTATVNFTNGKGTGSVTIVPGGPGGY